MAPEAYFEAQLRLDQAKREKAEAKFEKVREIFAQTLNELTKDAGFFDPILVQQDTPDEDGLEYLRVMVVFHGNPKSLPPGWKSELSMRVRPLMEEQGIMDFPVTYFATKSEWDSFVRKQERKGNVGAW